MSCVVFEVVANFRDSLMMQYQNAVEIMQYALQRVEIGVSTLESTVK